MNKDFYVDDDNLSLEAVNALLFLLKCDVGFLGWHHTDGYPALFLIMNDTFAFATSDAEEVPFENLIEVRALYDKFGSHGLTAWVAKKRNQQPIHCSCH